MKKEDAKQKGDFPESGTDYSGTRVDTLPKILDPVITMGVVQEYLSKERIKSRRALIWLGSVFTLAMVLILGLFVSIGMFVLKNSKNAAEIAGNMEARANAYVSEVSGISKKLSEYESDNKGIRNMVQAQEAKRSEEIQQLKSDFQRVRDWMDTGEGKSSGVISTLQSRLDGIEKIVAGTESSLIAERSRFEELIKLAGNPVNKANAGIRTNSDSFVDFFNQKDEAENATSALHQDEIAVPGDDGNGRDVSGDYNDEGIGDYSLSMMMSTSEPVKPPDCNKEVFSVKFANGDAYKGQFKDGFFNGWGVYTYANGDVYEGAFKDDMRDGNGTITFANKDKYIGEFKKGEQSGKGTIIYHNGNRYVGDFKDGIRYGKGIMRFASGDIYMGMFNGDSRNGKGTYIYSDGAKYIGEFSHGKKHGNGRYIYKSGEEYIGEFRDGLKSGTGVCIYPNGSQLKGLWRDDKLVKRYDE